MFASDLRARMSARFLPLIVIALSLPLSSGCSTMRPAQPTLPAPPPELKRPLRPLPTVPVATLDWEQSLNGW